MLHSVAWFADIHLLTSDQTFLHIADHWHRALVPQVQGSHTLCVLSCWEPVEEEIKVIHFTMPANKQKKCLKKGASSHCMTKVVHDLDQVRDTGNNQYTIWQNKIDRTLWRTRTVWTELYRSAQKLLGWPRVIFTLTITQTFSKMSATLWDDIRRVLLSPFRLLILWACMQDQQHEAVLGCFGCHVWINCNYKPVVNQSWGGWSGWLPLQKSAELFIAPVAVCSQ